MEVTLTRDISPNQRSWRNVPGMMRWFRQNHMITRSQQADWVERIEEDPTIEMFGIRADHHECGTIGLTGIDRDHRKAEYSILIAADYQQRGIGCVALALLLRYGFLNLGMNKIWGEIIEGNTGGLLVATKLGFHEVGKWRQHYFKEGRYVDCHCVDITRGEWNDWMRDNGLDQRYSFGARCSGDISFSKRIDELEQDKPESTEIKQKSRSDL